MISRKKITAMMIAGTLTITSLVSGCGKKDVDYNINGNPENNSENQTSDNHTSTEGGLAGRLGIPKSCDVSIDVGNSGLQSITIKDDDIEIPATEGMSIVYYQSFRMDNTYKQKIAETFFDKSQGIYEYVETKGDIERIIELHKENQKKLGGDAEADDIAWYEAQLVDAPDERPPAGDYSGESFIGMMNGQEYSLSLTIPPQREGSDLIPQSLKLDMQNKLEYRPYEGAYEVRTYGAFDKDVSDEINQCKMSKEEAIAFAEDFLFQCGATDMVPTRVCALEWNYEKKDWPVTEYDGYTIHFVKAPDQVPVFGEVKFADNLQIDWATTIDDPTEQYIVSVDDNGIISAYWDVLCSATGEEERHVDLLSWDEILTAANENIAGYYEKYPTNFSEITFDDVKLSYYLVPDESRENIYKYIPVWVFSEYMYDSTGYLTGGQLVILNAMDGTVLNILDIAKEMGTYHEFSFDD